MPLNALQRETLFSIITGAVDSILDSSIGYKIKMECLQKVMTGLPTVEQMIKIVKENPGLVKGLAEQVNVPSDVRGQWGTFLGCLNNNQPFPEGLLKNLEKINNYNPFYIAAMKIFENYIDATPTLAPVKTELIRLREIYLEMTPLTTYSYGEHYIEFSFRIGNIPLNLDHCGPIPIKGEIQEDVMRIISDRIEQAEKYQKELDAKEKDKLDMERIALSAQSSEKDLALAIGLFLSDSDEKQRLDQIKQAAVSGYRTCETAFSDPNSVDVVNTLVSQIVQQSSSTTVTRRTQPSPKNSHLLQMEIDLHGRITQDLNSTISEMTVLKAQLESSSAYLDLRKAEFCGVLLRVQLEVVKSCTPSTNRDAINKQYLEKIEATYKMYMDDMCTKWMAERHGRTLSPSELSALTEKFKQDINTTMKDDWQKFNNFKIDPNNIAALCRGIQAEIDKKDKVTQNLKDSWDTKIFPLVDLADKCNQLRKARQIVQKGDSVAFEQVVTILFRVSRDLSMMDQAKYTLLHYACLLGSVTLVREFLRKVRVNAHVKTPAGYGYYPLHLACIQQYPTTKELLELLLDSLLREPRSSRDPKIEISEILGIKTKRGKTLLHIAASEGNLAAAEWLVEKLPGAERLDILDDQGLTPLYYAAREGREDMVNYLLRCRANPRVPNQQRQSPLLISVLRGHIKVAQVFFQHGIWLNAEEMKLCSENTHSVIDVLNCLTVPVVCSYQVMSRVKLPVRTLIHESKLTAEIGSLRSSSNEASSSTLPQFSHAKAAAKRALELDAAARGKDIAEERTIETVASSSSSTIPPSTSVRSSTSVASSSTSSSVT